jgi:multicomponent Na+:H+ antiporter subunit F
MSFGLDWFLNPFNIIFSLLITALFLALVRLIKGPSLPDRVVALDLITLEFIGIIGVFVVAAEQPLFLDAAIALAIISFVGTVAFARYLERRGQDE